LPLSANLWAAEKSPRKLLVLSLALTFKFLLTFEETAHELYYTMNI